MTVPARTLMVMAGGTGGHIMPGLAVAEALRARGWRVVWMGNPTGMEARLVPAHGIELMPVQFSGVRGKGLKTLALLPFTLLRGFVQAWRVLRRERPDVVLGMGGYVAFPGGMMASLRHVPLVLHEQNAVAGMANKVLARVADHRLAGFPAALPDCEHTGNPVRDELTRLEPPAERLAGRSGPLRLLVVGGSLGAQALNTVIPQALAQMPADQRPHVMHQSGEKHLPALQQAYQQAGVQADCRAFIDDMAQAYAGADLVICRAGAMTVAEVAAVGVAALFVPLPSAVDDHQTANARYLVDGGAGWLCPQVEFTASWLAGWLAERTRPELLAKAQAAQHLAYPHATQRIADVCVDAARGA